MNFRTFLEGLTMLHLFLYLNLKVCGIRVAVAIFSHRQPTKDAQTESSTKQLKKAIHYELV